MRIREILYILLPALAVSCAGSDTEKFVPPTTPPGNGDETEEVSYSARAKEILDLINQYYRVSIGPTAGMYNENYPKRTSDNPVSFLWPYDGLISGVASLHELGYDVGYLPMVDRLEAYYRESGAENIGGYGSSTNGQTGLGDRFYDDNSIVGLDLVKAYELSGDQKYLARAKRIVDFLKSGEDDTFGGGLWWNESLKNVSADNNSNKPSCANGFATLFLLKYYSVCPHAEKAEVLTFAKRLYEWVAKNLRDPSDGCYWNDISAAGVINQTKWTYNTGAMISNGVHLFNITGEQRYLDQAQKSAEGSYSYFVRPNGGIALAYPDHDPWFTVKLVQAYMDIEPYYKNAGNYIGSFIFYLDHAWKNARAAEGLFYENWTGANEGRSEQLLMQDAALEALGIIALYKGETNKKEK